MTSLLCVIILILAVSYYGWAHYKQHLTNAQIHADLYAELARIKAKLLHDPPPAPQTTTPAPAPTAPAP